MTQKLTIFHRGAFMGGWLKFGYEQKFCDRKAACLIEDITESISRLQGAPWNTDWRRHVAGSVRTAAVTLPVLLTPGCSRQPAGIAHVTVSPDDASREQAISVTVR